MKRLLALVLGVLMSLSVIVSCSPAPADTGSVRALTSSAHSSASWLSDRLGDTDGQILLATEEEAARFDVDTSSLRDEGYVIRTLGDDTLVLGKTEKGLDRGVRYYANHCADKTDVNITYGEGYRVKDLTIAGRDIGDYSIVLSSEADETHTFAAEELQKYIALACGKTLSIVNERSGHYIALDQRLDDEILGDEGFTLTVDESGNLHIIGGKYRGCMYGVYELLEKYIGWRFVYNPQTTVYDKENDDLYFLYESDHVDIPADLNDTQLPSFAYRQGRNLFESGEHYVKLKDNYSGTAKYNRYGNCLTIGACHGVQKAAQAGAFSEYSLSSCKQPCYTNETFIEEFEEYALDWVEAQLSSGKEIGYTLTQVDVAQVDYPDFCNCKKCLNVIREEKSDAGPVLRFTNHMADVIDDEYPGLVVAMLSYNGTTRPCVTPPRDNVNISFCFIEDTGRYACVNHPIDGSKCTGLAAVNGKGTISNSSYAEDLKKWCEISKIVTVWYYPLNWTHSSLTFSTIKNLREDFKFLHDLGIHGVWVCTSNPLVPEGRETLDRLALYLIQRLIWNADISEEEYDAMIEDYLYALFEESGAYIKDYYDWLEHTSPECCFTGYMMMIFQDMLTAYNMERSRDDFEMCISMFDTAARIAPSAEIERGVLLASRAIYMRGLIATYYDWYINGTEAQKARYTEIWTHFRDLAVSTGYRLHESDEKVLTFEDFDITKNPGSMYPYLVSDPEWYNWRT